MAKVKPDSHIQSIKGKTGNFVYYSYKGRGYARAYVKPLNPDTERQRVLRGRFRDASISWRSLSRDVKEEYNRKAQELPMSGFNLYVSRYMKGEL